MNQPISDVTRDIARLVKSEFHLASVEFKHAAKDLQNHSKAFLISSVIALLGVLPLLAFVVVGLGDLLGDNYWLSSLIVAVLMCGVGGFVAYSSLQKMKPKDLALPHTRESVARSGQAISRKLQSVAQTAKDDLQKVTEIPNISSRRNVS